MSEIISAPIPEGTLQFVPLAEITRVREAVADPLLRAKILADIFRMNVLYMIRLSNSGHIGTSFSSMDIATWLWLEEMVHPNEKGKDPSDIYFSSKGHDVPALYSIFVGTGRLDFEMIHKLRRLGGLPGHPDVGTPFIAANTGSLGMGIAKARGMAIAKRQLGKNGRVYVMTGDGELQEGQIWESLQPTANGKFSEITAIVDHNKIQSDGWVREISDIGNIEEKFKLFGWEVFRCNGHDMAEFRDTLKKAKAVSHRPQIIIADTIKGKGVSFMERMAEDGTYKFHSGAPTYEQYQQALVEIRDRVNAALGDLGIAPLTLESHEMSKSTMPGKVERLIPAYGDELVKLGRAHKEIVVFDADLIPDTGVGEFKKEFPDRFFECGIAEQDMVSLAGGAALQGMLPIVHSFSAFLSTRPNEQIYNNATEKTKIIYCGCLAGLLPAMPGHSHQSVRDISCFGGVPGLVAIQPANELETRLAIRWAVEESPENVYIRFTSVASEAPFSHPDGYRLVMGRGAYLAKGSDVLLIGYGPIALTEAMKSLPLLKEKGISASVMDLPWLNRIDGAWLAKEAAPYRVIITLDDHYVTLGQGVQIAGALAQAVATHPRVVSFGLEEIPRCGHNGEVLQYHRLDYQSLAERITKTMGG